jgi:ABC-2 type transport system ATP-binding protein
MIEVEHLTKSYGRHTAVREVSFRAQPGTVTGFLGPNGAGKSTTLRMITGLTAPDAGSASILGVPYADLPNPGRRVGVLLDASAQHPGRSGREVLAVSAQLMGIDPRRPEALLSLAGLDRVATRRRVRDYSLGMRQRLGIAHALLGDPEVLILDEPANGLDPEGMRWMRELLRDFADRGGTVLLSSHLLAEVEALADGLVIISGGRIVAEGRLEELLAGSGTIVRAADNDGLGRALAAAGLQARPADRGGFVVAVSPDEIGEAALRAGIALRELRPADRGGLEDLFLRLTRDNGREPSQDSSTNLPSEEHR